VITYKLEDTILNIKTIVMGFKKASLVIYFL